MDPRDRLHAGQLASREGRYEEALREFVWFHDHSLEHRPSLYGVRLSFAIAYWTDLAEVYPPARGKLEEIRDRKTATLARGEGDQDLFHDVESINQALSDEDKTYRLFLTMLSNTPKLAHSCAAIALEAIIKAGDFQLAARHSDPPEEALLRFSSQLNEDIAGLKGDAERIVTATEADVRIYCDRVANVIAILDGLGKSEEAIFCRVWAEVLVESSPVRRRVHNLLANRYDV